jgi:hypothetical protein
MMTVNNLPRQAELVLLFFLQPTPVWMKLEQKLVQNSQLSIKEKEINWKGQFPGRWRSFQSA